MRALGFGSFVRIEGVRGSRAPIGVVWDCTSLRRSRRWPFAPRSESGSAVGRAAPHLRPHAGTADASRTRSSRSGRHRAPCKAYARDISPDALSRIRILGRNRIGLLRKPGGGFFQNLLFDFEILVFTAKSPKLFALCGSQPVASLARVAVGLCHPVAYRLGRGLKLPRELLRAASRADQLHQSLPELRRVSWPVSLRHVDSFARNRASVHETGSTPWFSSGTKRRPPQPRR